MSGKISGGSGQLGKYKLAAKPEEVADALMTDI